MGFSDLGKKLSKIGQDTKNGVQKVSDSVSISNRITAEKKSLERLYASIGEAVYKESPDVAKEGLEDEWAAVKVAYANIASLNDQLNHVKGIIYCPNCGRPAAKGDKFCAKCGFRLDNLQETTGSKVAQDIREAGQEVGKLAGNAADKTGELVGGAAADTKNFFSRLKDGAAKIAKNAGSKMKSRMTSEDIETDDFGMSAMEEAQNAEEDADAVSAVDETLEDAAAEVSAVETVEEETLTEKADLSETDADEYAGEPSEPENESGGRDEDSAEEAVKKEEIDEENAVNLAMDAVISGIDEDNLPGEAEAADPVQPAQADENL